MLFLVTALSCEAAPLIDHFNLKKRTLSANFTFYENSTLALIVSGIGKNNVATAIGLLNGLFPNPLHSWLNVGIAGHRNSTLAEGYFIHKITDSSTTKNYYPIFAKPVFDKTASLITVEKPEKLFEEEALYDMEGSAFFHSCSKFSTAELIHSYKVISDNSENSFEGLDKRSIYNFIGDKIESIELMVASLQQTTTLLENIHRFQEQNISEFLCRWHFTEKQKLQLKRLLQKWRAVEQQTSIWDSTLEQLRKTALVLQYLEEKINATAINF